jgi:hypothetical protein
VGSVEFSTSSLSSASRPRGFFLRFLRLRNRKTIRAMAMNSNISQSYWLPPTQEDLTPNESFQRVKKSDACGAKRTDG